MKLKSLNLTNSTLHHARDVVSVNALRDASIRMIQILQLIKLLGFPPQVCRRKYLITLVVFVVIVGFLDENSIVRRMGYANEISRLNNEIEKYRAEYEENTERLNELAVDSGAIERIAREKYLMKKPNEDIYVFEEDIEK